MAYKKEVKTLDEQIFSKMRICSFNLVCDAYKIDFASAKEHELYVLHKDAGELSAYFSIPGATENVLKISLSQAAYQLQIKVLVKELLFEFVFVLVVVLILSILFSLYTLAPLRNALILTEEFIKDILHDFNTPLSTLRLNARMLKAEIGENPKINRVENSVQNILNLQENLRAYLTHHAIQKESFDLKTFLEERVGLIEKNYPLVGFSVNIEVCTIETNREAFARVIDNLVSNAAKYNRANGEVILLMQGSRLEIKDTGKGIKNPAKVFDRFYKEQERGIGIGLHIVKKLCDELGITLVVKSEINVGSSFFLELKTLSH